MLSSVLVIPSSLVYHFSYKCACMRGCMGTCMCRVCACVVACMRGYMGVWVLVCTGGACMSGCACLHVCGCVAVCMHACISVCEFMSGFVGVQVHG